MNASPPRRLRMSGRGSTFVQWILRGESVTINAIARCSMKVLRFFVLILLMSPLGHVTWATDDLYRCADGTFTNRLERQCQPYESTGIVRVQAATAEAAKQSIATGEEDQQPFGEVKRFQESAEPQEVRSGR
jgi:hypothetical protein